MSFTLKPYVNTGQTAQPKFPYAPLHWGLKGTGDLAPIVPGGYAIRLVSYSVSRMGLVTGDNLNSWQSEPPPTLSVTQATSGNQPTLFEYDVVKQSTLANQPTFVDTGAELVIRSNNSTVFMDGIVDESVSKTYQFEIKFTDIGNQTFFQNSLGTSNNFIRILTINGNIRITSAEGNNFDFSGAGVYDDFANYVINLDGNDLELVVNGVSQGVKDFTGNTLNIDRLGSSVSSSKWDCKSIRIFNTSVADPTNIVETPDFELIPQASLMRNSANATPSLGDTISAWLSTTHKPYQNEVRKDGNNTYMIGLPTQAGDFSYVYAREQVDIQAQDKRIASSNTTSAEIGFDASEQLYMIADDGTRYTWTGVINDGTEKIWIPWREGNTLGVYDGYVEDAQTFDVTGKAFTIDQWGAPSLSSNGYGKEPTVYPFKVDQTQANWWSYVRLEDGTIVLDEDGNPQLPSVPVAVNSFNFNGTNQSLNGGNILNAGTADIFSGTVRFKTSNSNSQQIMTKVNTSVNQDYYYTQIVTGGKFKIGFSLGSTNAYVVSTSNSFSDGNWHVAVFTLVRSTKTMTIEIDGVNQAFTVDINQGSLVGTQSNTHDFLIADRDVDDNFIFDGPIAFAGLSFGTDLLAFSSELAQSDAKCYDDFTQPLKDAFATGDYFDCTTYNGRTELQARTGRANGNVLTNVNNTPLTGTGLTVECNS